MRWLVLVLCLAAQTAWSDLLSIQGRAPDLLLLGILWAAAARPPWQGALLGFLAGLGADLAGAQDPLGAGALAGTSAGFFAALWLHPALRLNVWRSLGRAAALLAPLEVLLAHARYRGMDYQVWETTLRLALPTWLYTLLLLLLLLWIPGARGSDGRR